MLIACDTVTVTSLVTLLDDVCAPVAPEVVAVVLDVASFTVTMYVPGVVSADDVSTPLLIPMER